MIVLAIAFPASELLLSHQSIITSTQIIPPRQQCQLLPTERRIFMISSTAKSGSSASNKTFREFWLKKQPPLPLKNRFNNKCPPDEPMVECRAADECISECDNRNDGQGAADNPFPDSDASFVLAREDSMSSEDDDDQNDFIFDDMFGLEATDDGTTDDGQSLKTTSASCQGTNINGNPQVMMYQDEEEQPPTAEDDIEFTNLEVAELELLMLCDASGARRRFFDDL
jgi:hypothetical protein